MGADKTWPSQSLRVVDIQQPGGIDTGILTALHKTVRNAYCFIQFLNDSLDSVSTSGLKYNFSDFILRPRCQGYGRDV